MALSRKEIERLNSSTKNLTKSMRVANKSNRRERQKWEMNLINRITKAKFNKADLASLIMVVDRMTELKTYTYRADY